MKNRQIFKTACVLFIAFWIGCTANQELLKRQSESIRNVGEAYMAEQKYTQALSAFMEAEKLYADDPYLQNNFGLVYMAKKRPEIAVEHFKKAIELKPDFAVAKNNLGTAYLELKNWDDAIRCFKEVTENLVYATPHYAFFNLGRAYYSKKDYVSAIKGYNDALDHYRDGFQKDDLYYQTLRGLSQTYVAMERLSDAEKTILEALEDAAIKNYRGMEVLFCFDLAKIYTLQRQYNKASNVYGHIIDMVPDTPLAEKAAEEAEKIRKY